MATWARSADLPAAWRRSIRPISFSSGVGQFRKRSLRSAGKAGSSPRLLLLSSAIGEASRRNADALAGRSLAAILLTGRYAEHRGLWCPESPGATLSLPVSAVCERRNEWNGNAACEVAVKWSGAVAKLTSPASGAAEACRYLARQRSASVGSVTPGLLPFQRGATATRFQCLTAR